MNKKRILSSLIIVLLLFTFNCVGNSGISYGANDTLGNSSTLGASQWALEDIDEAIFYGLIPPEFNELSLSDSITREEFASLAVRVWEKETNKVVGIPKINPFLDTDSKNVLKAFELGIVKGLGNGKYGPQETLTREEAATMLARIYLKLTKTELEATKTQNFDDDNKIHIWAKESVYYMAKRGLLKGNYTNEFMPLELISREQAVVISVRMVKEIFKGKLDYIPKAEYTPWMYAKTVADVEEALRYAQFHLIPSVSLSLDSSLAKSLPAEYSDIINKLEIEKITYPLNPNNKMYTISLKYSLMAEVIALTLNDEIDLKKVSSQARQIQAQLLGIIDNLISPEMDYYKREKAIHDYIVMNHSYDLGIQGNGKMFEDSYSLSGLLLNGKGVCQGYSQLFTALCLNTKIPSSIVKGTADGGRHAWNMVEIYGTCYHVDVTWNDPVPDRGASVRYTYFNVSEDFIKKDHQWNSSHYPSCDFVTDNN